MGIKRREPPNRYLPDVFHGVWLRIVPAHKKALIEIERAPDVAGAPGAWAQVAVVGPFAGSGGYYVDARPSDDALLWYRCRHAAAPLWGNPSSYLQIASAVRARNLSWADLVAQSEASSPFEPGPNLDVKAVPGATNYTINYTIDADVELFEYSIDGAAFTSVPASGFTVTRPAAGSNHKTLFFHARKNGQWAENLVGVPAIDKDTVTPDLSVTQTAQSTTQVSLQATVANPGGGATPSLTVTFVNCSSPDYVGAGPHTIASGTTVVIDRPDYGSNQATVKFRAEISGGGIEEISRTVVNKRPGPSLEIRAVPGATNYTINYTVDATTFEYSVDGAAYGSVPASGFTVTRPSAGSNHKTLSFRAIKDGQTILNSVAVPAIDKDTVTPDLQVVQGGVSTTATQYTITATNPSGGTTPTVKVKGLGCSIDIHSDGGNGSVAGVYGSGVEVTLAGVVGAVIDALRGTDETTQATFKVLAEIAGGGKEEISRTVPPKPNTNQGSIDLGSEDDDVIMNASGPAPANSLRYAVSSSSMPSDSSVDSGTVVSGRVSRTVFSGAVPNLGNKYYVKARFYTGASGDGLGGPYLTAEIERQNKAATKTLRIPAQGATWWNDGTSGTPYGNIQQNGATVRVSLASANNIFGRVYPSLAKGLTITAIRARVWRDNASDILNLAFYSIDDSGAFTQIGSTASAASSGVWETLAVGSLSQSTSGSTTFLMEIRMDPNTVGNEVKIAWWEIDYTSPDLVTTT